MHGSLAGGGVFYMGGLTIIPDDPPVTVISLAPTLTFLCP